MAVLLDTDEYVDPCTHAAHVTSSVVLPATDTPWPAGHACHAVHAGYDVVSACQAPPPKYPVSHVHVDLSPAITPLRHETTEHDALSSL